MPKKELFSLLASRDGSQILFGSFGTDTTNDPPASTKSKAPFSVVRTSAGLYTVTLTGVRFREVDAFLAFLQLNTADDKYVQGGAVSLTPATGQTFQIRIWDASGAAVTDGPAAGANNRVHFIIAGVRAPQ